MCPKKVVHIEEECFSTVLVLVRWNVTTLDTTCTIGLSPTISDKLRHTGLSAKEMTKNALSTRTKSQSSLPSFQNIVRPFSKRSQSLRASEADPSVA